jgi:serine/threonine-protein kinase
MAESRYEPLFKLAAGGMATVWIGTARGAHGFRQLVAIKRPHPHLLEDPHYRKELIAEARLASLIRHTNVVDVRDIEVEGTSLQLIMDYIEGASLAELLTAAGKAARPLEPAVVLRIALDACAGLHAAHELLDEKGRPVGLVHRDVSPQNLIVGVDGTTRVSDFGVAKLTAGMSTTQGVLKGKLAYMAPEYLRGEKIDRRVDVFAMGVVLYEALSGQRLFRGQHDADTLQRVLNLHVPPISTVAPSLGTHLDPVLEMALAKAPEERFANMAAFGAALEASAQRAGQLTGHGAVAAALQALVGPTLEARRVEVRAKMALEPSVLSMMGAEPPKELANLNETAAPSTQPMNTLPLDAPPPMGTLPLEPPQQTRASAAPTVRERGVGATAVSAEIPFEPPQEPSRGYDPMEISRPPQRGTPVWVLPVALLAVVGIGAGAAVYAQRGPRPSAAATSAPTAKPTATHVASAASTTEPVEAPMPSLAPLTSAKPKPTGSAHGKPAGTATATGDNPPPNPYN